MIVQVVFFSIHIFPTQQNTNPIFPYLAYGGLSQTTFTLLQCDPARLDFFV
jgi:hypothetical protein